MGLPLLLGGSWGRLGGIGLYLEVGGFAELPVGGWWNAGNVCQSVESYESPVAVCEKHLRQEVDPLWSAGGPGGLAE